MGGPIRNETTLFDIPYDKAVVYVRKTVGGLQLTFDFL